MINPMGPMTTPTDHQKIAHRLTRSLELLNSRAFTFSLLPPAIANGTLT